MQLRMAYLVEDAKRSLAVAVQKLAEIILKGGGVFLANEDTNILRTMKRD